MKKKKLLSYEAKVIIGVLLFLAIIILRLPILDTFIQLKTDLINFYKGHFQHYPLWIDLLVLSSPLIIFILIKLIKKNRSKYTEDIIYNIKWKWRWAGKNVVNLQCFCPDCNEELLYDDTTSNYILSVSKIDFICDKCHRIVGSIHNENRKHRSQMNVKKEIERIINKKVD